MGVHESIGYRLVCDWPGCGFDTESMNDEYSSWTDRGYAIDEWREGDGYHGPEGTYCPTHTIWTTDEFDERVEIVPMPYTIDSLFVLAERRIADRIERSARRALDEHARRIRSWELADASIERRVRVRLGDGGWHDLRAYSHTLVDATRRAAEAVRGG